MFGYLKRIVRRRRAERTAAAWFRQRNATVTYMARVLDDNDDRAVVRLCFGNSKPPRRAWVSVRHGDASVEPLTWDDVVPFGEKPWL
jgi:hypothetical protein